VTGVPVTITRRGHKSAVIISAEEFERYQTARMDDEFAAIMAVHGDEIRELADK
jgi:antitoxin Phd